MTYTTPELLLGGATQNLILFTCDGALYDDAKSQSVTEDNPPFEYNPGQ